MFVIAIKTGNLYVRILSIILALLVLSSCSSSIVQLRKVEPQGNLFQIYLAREYLDFAEAEADQYDWFDSAYFARKGLKSAKGIDVYPEDLRDWDIADETLPTIQQAREHMMTVLASNVSNRFPKEAAKMQFFFDCWVEQEEENWQGDHIDYCREHFYDMLDKLYAETTYQLPPTPYRAAADLMPEAAPQPVHVPVAPADVVTFEANATEDKCPLDCLKTKEIRTVYFGFNSSKISQRTQRVVSNIIAMLKDKKDYTITLNGYADRVGSEEYNMNLSKKRAQSVKKMLTENGIDAKSVMLFAFGEVHGLLETKDGIAEKENRAVEIVVEF